MSDVEFNEPQYDVPHAVAPKKESFLTRAMIDLGLATDSAGAQRVLLFGAIGIAVLAVVVYFLFTPSEPPAGPVP